MSPSVYEAVTLFVTLFPFSVVYSEALGFMFTAPPASVIVASLKGITLSAPDLYIIFSVPLPVSNVSPCLNSFFGSSSSSILSIMSFIVIVNCVGAVYVVPFSSLYVTFSCFFIFPSVNSDAVGLMFIALPSASVIDTVLSVIDTVLLDVAPLAYVKLILPPCALNVSPQLYAKLFGLSDIAIPVILSFIVTLNVSSAGITSMSASSGVDNVTVTVCSLC